MLGFHKIILSMLIIVGKWNWKKVKMVHCALSIRNESNRCRQDVYRFCKLGLPVQIRIWFVRQGRHTNSATLETNKETKKIEKNWKRLKWYTVLCPLEMSLDILVTSILRARAESTKLMEEKLNFQVPSEGWKLVILLHTQY